MKTFTVTVKIDAADKEILESCYWINYGNHKQEVVERLHEVIDGMNDAQLKGVFVDVAFGKGVGDE